MIRAALISLFVTACAGASWGTPEQPLPEGLGHWNHDFQARFAMQQGPPHHSAVDPVVGPGEGATLQGKFAYGNLSKDLEDEDVVGYVQHRGRWFNVGTARTDGDGRISIPVSADRLSARGEYPFRLVVRGDHSMATGAIWVVARESAFVVFDIDGTLTENRGEGLEQLLMGVEPAERTGAVSAAEHWASDNVQPLYLTGRPNLLASSTRLWLERKQFPHGPLAMAPAIRNAVAGGVVEFKASVLRDLTSRLGIRFLAAYGDSETDMCAYAQGGVLPSATYLFGDHGGESCAGYPATTAVTDYAAHLTELDP